MPTYDYRCDSCEHEFEHFQSMSDPVLRKCPRCGRLRLRRLIGTGAGLIFKGSGFYITDYRNESYKDAASKDAPAAEPKDAAAAKPAESGEPAGPVKSGETPAAPAPRKATRAPKSAGRGARSRSSRKQ